MRIPDWRWRQVRKAFVDKVPPEDSFLNKVYSVMCGEKQDIIISYAVELIENPAHSNSIVAYFLSRAIIPQISRGLGIPENVLEIFAALCMDLSVFRNKLEIRDYTQYYIECCCVDETHRREVQVGYTNGAIALDFSWNPEEASVTEKQVTRAALALSYTKMIIARDAPLLSPVCKEGLKWANFALKAAPVHTNIPDKNAEETDALAAIERHRSAKKIQQLGVDPDQLIH
jgi:hypothetical protein